MQSQRKRRWTIITRTMGIRDTLEETTREVGSNVDSKYQQLEREHGFHK
jgi:hypothetical protein